MASNSIDWMVPLFLAQKITRVWKRWLEVHSYLILICLKRFLLLIPHRNQGPKIWCEVLHFDTYLLMHNTLKCQPWALSVSVLISSLYSSVVIAINWETRSGEKLSGVPKVRIMLITSRIWGMKLLVASHYLIWYWAILTSLSFSTWASFSLSKNSFLWLSYKSWIIWSCFFSLLGVICA
jgi:hypothetical protein